MASHNNKEENKNRPTYQPIALIPREGTGNNNQTINNLPNYHTMPLQNFGQRAGNINPQGHVSEQQVHRQEAGQNRQLYFSTQQGYGQQATNSIPQHGAPVPPQMFQHTHTQVVGNINPQGYIPVPKVHKQKARKNTQPYFSTQQGYGQQATNTIPQHGGPVPPQIPQHTHTQVAGNINPQGNISVPQLHRRKARESTQPYLLTQHAHGQQATNTIPQHGGPVPPQMPQHTHTQVAGNNNPQGITSMPQVHSLLARNNPQQVFEQEARHNIPQYNVSQVPQRFQQVAGNNPQSHTSTQSVHGQKAKNNILQCGISPNLQKLQQLVDNPEKYMSTQQTPKEETRSKPQHHGSKQQVYRQEAGNIPQHGVPVPPQMPQYTHTQMAGNNNPRSYIPVPSVHNQEAGNIPQYGSSVPPQMPQYTHTQVAGNNNPRGYIPVPSVHNQEAGNIPQYSSPVPPQMPQHTHTQVAGNNNPRGYIPVPLVHNQEAGNIPQYSRPVPPQMPQHTHTQVAGNNNPRGYIPVPLVHNQEAGNIPQYSRPVPPQMPQHTHTQVAGNNNPQGYIPVPSVHNQEAGNIPQYSSPVPPQMPQHTHTQVAGNNNPRGYIPVPSVYNQEAGNIPQYSSSVPPQMPQHTHTQMAGNNNPQGYISVLPVHNQGAGNNPQCYTSTQSVHGQRTRNNIPQCNISSSQQELQQMIENQQPYTSKRQKRKQKEENNTPRRGDSITPQMLPQVAENNNPQVHASQQKVYSQRAENTYTHKPQVYVPTQQARAYEQQTTHNIPQHGDPIATEILQQTLKKKRQRLTSTQGVLEQEAGNNIPQYDTSQTLQRPEQMVENNPQHCASTKQAYKKKAESNIPQRDVPIPAQMLQPMAGNNNPQGRVSEQQVHGARNNPQSHASMQSVLEQEAGNNIPQYDASQTLQRPEHMVENNPQHCASTKEAYKKKAESNIPQRDVSIPAQMLPQVAENNNPQGRVSEQQVHGARNNPQSHASMQSVLEQEAGNNIPQYDASQTLQRPEHIMENNPQHCASTKEAYKKKAESNIPQCDVPIPPQMLPQVAENNNPQGRVSEQQVHGARNNPQSHASMPSVLEQEAEYVFPEKEIEEARVILENMALEFPKFGQSLVELFNEAMKKYTPKHGPISLQTFQEMLENNNPQDHVSQQQIYEQGVGNNPQAHFPTQQAYIYQQETTNNIPQQGGPIPPQILQENSSSEINNSQDHVSEQENHGQEEETANERQSSILFNALNLVPRTQVNNLQHPCNKDVRNSSLVRYQRNFSHSRPPPAETSGVAIETEQFFNSEEHLSSGISPAAVQVPPFAPQTNFNTALPTTVGFVPASNHPNAIVPGGVCNSTAGGDKNDDSCPEQSVLKHVDTRSSAEPQNQRSSAVLENIELSFADDISTIESVEEQLIDDTSSYNIIGSSNTQTGEPHIPTSDVTSDMKYETQSGPPPAQPHMTSTGVEPPHSSQGPGMMVGSSPTDAEGVTVMLPPWNGGAPDYLDQSGIKQSSQGLSDNWDSLLINQTLDGPQSQIAADRRPLPSFIGYTSNLSINGISGLHYHTIASSVQIAVMPSGSPTQSTNPEYYGSVVPDTQEYQEPPVVSSSTPCQQGSQKQQQQQQQHTNNQQHCNQYQHHHHNHHEQQAPQSTQQIDLDIEADIALLISNAIAADTTVSSGGSSGNDANSANDGATGNGNPSLVQEQDNTSRHTSPWNDIVDWFDTACTTNKHQEANVYTVYSTSSPAQTQQHGPSIPNLLTYSPLLQARLQAGNAETPSSTSTYPPVSPPGRVSTSGSPDQNLHSSYTAPSHSRKRSRGSQGTQNPAKKAATAISYSNDANMAGGKEKPVHRCSICSRGFLNKSNIKVHLRTHTGEKPFKCTTCEKTFRQKAHLIKHQQIHKRGSRD